MQRKSNSTNRSEIDFKFLDINQQNIKILKVFIEAVTSLEMFKNAKMVHNKFWCVCVCVWERERERIMKIALRRYLKQMKD